MLPVIYPMSYPYSTWMIPRSRSVMLGSTESEHPTLISHDISFKVFQPMWSRHDTSTSQTDGRTDGRLAVIIHRTVKSLSIQY